MKSLKLNAFNAQVNEVVSGEVTVQLYKGSTTVVAMSSVYGLNHASFSAVAGFNFNVNASPGFIELYTLQMRTAAQLKQKGK